MPRKKRQESPTGIYHWIVRGMNRKILFHGALDYLKFKSLLLEHKSEHHIQIFHYCLMTNHVHVLLKSHSTRELALFSQMTQRRYAYWYASCFKWSGSVFQRGYKSFPIDKESYLLECGRYIERNPVKASCVTSPADYPYSSYNYYAQGAGDELLTPSPAYEALHEDAEIRRKLYREYVSVIRIQEEMIERNLLPV